MGVVEISDRRNREGAGWGEERLGWVRGAKRKGAIDRRKRWGGWGEDTGEKQMGVIDRTETQRGGRQKGCCILEQG